MTNVEVQNKIAVKHPISRTCHEMIVEVAKLFGYEPFTFLLIYEKPDDSGTYTEVFIYLCLLIYDIRNHYMR